MIPSSGCPPWQPDHPGQTAGKRNETVGSYTTARDTIFVNGSQNDQRWLQELLTVLLGLHAPIEEHPRYFLTYTMHRRSTRPRLFGRTPHPLSSPLQFFLLQLHLA